MKPLALVCEVCGEPATVHRKAPRMVFDRGDGKFAAGDWIYCYCDRHAPPSAEPLPPKFRSQP